MMATLEAQLQHLTDSIVVPKEEDGTPARLLALMPAEPAVGEVAVACWADSEDGELIELVRLADGSRVDDHVALRETLTLLAMVETVEELASFDALQPLHDELSAWVTEHSDLPETFISAQAASIAGLEALLALAPGDAPRIARTGMLDELGAALRALETAWERLEQAASLWSDAQLADDPNSVVRGSEVQALWRMLGGARRGPLAKPVSTALHEGREAGIALAAAIAEAKAPD